VPLVYIDAARNMADDMEDNGADVSDAMSENEYDDDNTTIKEDEDDKMAEHDGNGEVKKKYDPKDPSRPRRKKARRACFACQRAHLTCGTFGCSPLCQMRRIRSLRDDSSVFASG
jgi:hypothetical protein